MSATEQDVLTRLGKLRSGGTSADTDTNVAPDEDINARLQAVRAGIRSPSSPPTVQPPGTNLPPNKYSDYLSSELTLGIAEGLGIDPAHPLTSTIHGIISGSTAMPRLLAHPPELRATVAGMFNAIPETAHQIKSSYDSGDYAQLANGVGRAISLGGMLYGAGKVLKRPIGIMSEGMGATPPELPPSGGFGKPRPEVPTHVQQLTEAVGKTNKIFVEDRFHQAVNNAFPDLKAAEHTTLGRNVQDLRDVADVANAASKNAWQPYQHVLDSTKTPIDRLDLLREANANIPDAIKKNQTAAYKNMVGKFARDLGQRAYTAQEIEDAAQALNAKLKAYYTKNNLDRVAASKLPATAGDEALLSAYRNILDRTIKSDTGIDAAPLRKRYGDIKAVHNAVIESPSGDDTLYDVLTRRPTDLMRPTGMVKALASHVMQQTPDQLAARAFRGFTPESSTAIAVRPTPPTEPTPTTETVNVTSTTQPSSGRVTPMPESSLAQAQRTQRNRALTTGQRQLPAAGDTSVKVTPAPPESFSEALKREQTPQSQRMREVVGQGSYNIQAAPTTANDYIKTKGGRQMSRSEILADPTFQALNNWERFMVLHESDPEFRAMTGPRRWRVATRVPRPPTPPPSK
jgi:hypothetical protein